ncbi:Zinc finger, CCHC-type [Gossypium australe]|uniref:Zinc finger, CCHC-type n=1 Tax=Gossypium australe TaxID=47621 RepID=A0A5B6VQ04_9ROSI|nr:Zinc finger, CCHC-type [Gossypium australe]
MIKGDSLTVIKKLQANRKDDSCISAYISNLKSLRKRFKNFIFSHIQRQGNQVVRQCVRNVGVSTSCSGQNFACQKLVGDWGLGTCMHSI